MRNVFLACVVAFLAVSFHSTPRAFAGTGRPGLNNSVPGAKMIGIPLVDAIAYLHDVSTANINVDWKALEAANVGKDTPININLRNVSLAKVLSLVLSQAGGGGDLLTYYVHGNVIEITTREVADKQILVVAYYVDDLLSLDDTFDYTVLNSFSPSPSGGGGGSSGGGGGGTSSIFGGSSGSQNSSQNPAATKQQKADNLIKLIEKMIKPEVWKDNGGNSQIQYFNGNLVVAAPRSVQELIGGPVN
jgi:hypothetical protein